MSEINSTSRALFEAGASARAVLVHLKIKQRRVAEATGYPPNHISAVLKGTPGAIGIAKQLGIFRVVAGLVGVPVEVMPEARALMQKEAARG